MSTREQIRDYWINRLKQIKIANGYNNDVKIVSKYFNDLYNIKSFPAIVVFLGEENYNRSGQFFYTKNLTIYIVAITDIMRDINETGKIVDKNESLIEDIVKCINANEQDFLTQYNVMNAYIESVAPYVSVSDEGATIGQIEITYRVEYAE